MALSSQFMAGVGTAMKDLLLANVASAVAGVSINIFGLTIKPFAFLQSWANDLTNQANQALLDAATAQAAADTANTGVSTVASGVTGNITGATSSSSASAVGGAVSTLNSTVQTTATPPKITIVNTTQNYTQDAGAKSYTFNIFGAAGCGARGPTTAGQGYPGAPGGIGGWHQVTIPASSLPSVFRCVIGAVGAQATADNTAGGDGGDSMITSTDGSVIYARATGGKGGKPIPTSVALPTTAYNGASGSGNQTWGLSALSLGGGVGGERGINSGNGYQGSSGSAGSGGAGGNTGGGPGGNGGSNTSTVTPGLGGSGGGGGDGGGSGNAGAGGNGGTPGGAGGGGGGFYTAGVNGNGGIAGPGQIWIQTNY